MRSADFHLNLLAGSERLSSSPIRVRVMLPVLAALALVGVLIWWGTITTQLMFVRSQIAAADGEMQAKRKTHEGIISRMTLANEEAAQLRQLELYRGGCNRWANELAALAEVLPEGVQLVRMEIPPPPPQVLHESKKTKKTQPSGPTNDTESVTLTLAGRTAEDSAVVAFVNALGTDRFTNAIGRVSVRSFQQEAQAARDGERRLLTFEIECEARPRRFAK